MGQKQKVVVAMSGGVDSSVAAGLLVRQGYEVIGMMLRLWSESGSGAANRCCTPDAMALARRVAAKLEIPFYAIDAQEPFHNRVVNHFIEGYRDGVTPNPCLACNRTIRWGLLYEKALAFSADFLATGHYARIRQDDQGMYHLLCGVDLKKDQAYVLSVLSQEKLAHSIFPLGEYIKPEVRALAHEMDLPVAERAESQDLCFIGDGNYRRFLAEHSPDSIRAGAIRDRHGQMLGEHQGLAFYTIGQRKGLGVASSNPLYVIDKDLSTNTLVIGSADELGKDELVAENVNWISGNAPENPFRARLKIRYRAEQTWGMVIPEGPTRIRVNFENKLRDITPGQAAVVYNGDECLGGGIIQV